MSDADIRQRIQTIENELFARDAYFDTSILRPADPPRSSPARRAVKP